MAPPHVLQGPALSPSAQRPVQPDTAESPHLCEHLAGRVGRGRNAAHFFLSSMPSAPKGVDQKATGHDGDPCEL